MRFAAQMETEMIAYEIQLRYVIRDKIQSETKFEKNIYFV